MNFAVVDRTDLEAWVFRLDDFGVELHLYSQQRHGIDQTGRSGYGRVIASPS